MIVLAKVAAAVFPGTAEHGLAHGLPSSLFFFFFKNLFTVTLKGAYFSHFTIYS